LRRAEGGAKFVWVFRVKNHDFTPKNLIYSNCGGRRENFGGISCEKSRFYAKKSFFPILGGHAPGVPPPPPGSAPGLDFKTSPSLQSIINLCQILKFVRKKITIKKTDEFNTVRILFCSDNQWGGLEYNKCLNCTL
jgi:hypothetical protein